MTAAAEALQDVLAQCHLQYLRHHVSWWPTQFVVALGDVALEVADAEDQKLKAAKYIKSNIRFIFEKDPYNINDYVYYKNRIN